VATKSRAEAEVCIRNGGFSTVRASMIVAAAWSGVWAALLENAARVRFR